MAARVALVTGAAQGIGYAIAIRLAEDGLNVAINDIPSKREKIDAAVSEIRALGRESVAVPADVSSEKEVKEMIEQTVTALGGLDVMVANAGIGFINLFSKQQWRTTMHICTSTRGESLTVISQLLGR